MKERPILFSGPMVNAILRKVDPKTQTRRIVKPQPASDDIDNLGDEETIIFDGKHVRCPYGAPGDRLWVRESFSHIAHGRGFGVRVRYSADDAERAWMEPPSPIIRQDKWRPISFRSRPSIHMPRALSRIDLEVTAVRVERLHDMPEQDAWAEGIEAVDGMLDDGAIALAAKANGWTIEDARASFAVLWDEINGDKHPWKSNPWVWVVSFRRIKP